MRPKSFQLKMAVWLMLGFMVIFSIEGCESEENRGDESTDNSSLMFDSEISDATFINLNFSKFPSLPSFQIPANNVIYVSTSGINTSGDGSKDSPFGSIVQALVKSKSGDSIVISGGTYPEEAESGDYRALIIDKSNLTIMAAPGETVNLVPANQNVNYGVNVMANNFTILGINIKDFEQGILFGDNTLENMVIANCTITGASEGIATWDGTINNLLAFNVSIIDATLIGFHCGNGYGNNWRLENCTITMIGTNSGSGADAFAIEHGDNILLINCDISGAAADGIDTKATRVVVYACSVHHLGRNGIKLWHGGDVINCLVHHTGADASIVVEQGTVRLLNTTVGYHNFNGETSYNMTFGYDTRDTMDIKLINCIFFNTSGGAWMNPNATLTVSHCLFFGMENGKILDHGDRSVLISQGSNGLSLFGSNNLVINPYLKSDFHPSSTSPVINAGTQLSNYFPLKDKNNNPRVKNGAPDLGPSKIFKKTSDRSGLTA